MIPMTNRYLLGARNLLRATGLNRLAGRMIHAGGYEAGLNQAIRGSLVPGDRVWDVGANIGYYTIQFSDLIGDEGRVYAFEPSPENRARLQDAVAGRGNVEIVPVGLSDEPTEAVLAQGDDDLGATSRILEVGETSGPGLHSVRLESGDALVLAGRAETPNVLKIDVEGYELEVLRGLRSALAGTELRHVFVEVHFGILERRGLKEAPAKIEQILRDSGFRLKWLDPSHLNAYRAS